MMNVITGIFVESALKKMERKKDETFAEHVRVLFHLLEPDHDGQIKKEDYMTHLEDPQLQAYMSDIDIDPGEAKLLFDFLDCDGSNTIDSEELLNGLIRLRQGSKFMDIMTIMHELEQMGKQWATFTVKMEEEMGLIRGDMQLRSSSRSAEPVVRPS